MKKLLILFMSFAVLAACSSDDDNTDAEQKDPIIGTWVLVDTSAELDGQFCLEEDSVMTFNENNTGNATFYLTATECEPETSEGNWENTGSNRYTISLPALGNVPGTATFSGQNTFSFTTALGTLNFERQ